MVDKSLVFETEMKDKRKACNNVTVRWVDFTDMEAWKNRKWRYCLAFNFTSMRCVAVFVLEWEWERERERWMCGVCFVTVEEDSRILELERERDD